LKDWAHLTLPGIKITEVPRHSLDELDSLIKDPSQEEETGYPLADSSWLITLTL